MEALGFLYLLTKFPTLNPSGKRETVKTLLTHFNMLLTVFEYIIKIFIGTSSGLCQVFSRIASTLFLYSFSLFTTVNVEVV